MKLGYTIVNICSALILCSTAVHAEALTGTMLIDPGITTAPDEFGETYYVSGSYFVMGNNPSVNSGMLSPGSAGGVVLGTYQNFVLDPDEPHLLNWDGLGSSAGTGYNRAGPTTQSTMLAPFSFFNNSTYVGTNPVGYQSGEAHFAPTADISNCVGTSCTLSVDLSSWEVLWNGSAFEQGPRPLNSGPFVPAVGTYDTATGAYSLTWKSQIKGGPFNSVTGTWHLEGTVTPVPEPAAVWLFAGGLLVLLGISRRKTTA